MINMLIILFLIIAFLVVIYMRTPTAVLVRAGGVSTPECIKKPAITKNNKPILFKLPPFKAINYSGFDKKQIVWGKAVGNSMKPKGISNGDIFMCEKDAKDIKAGDIVMIKIDGSPDSGGYKLREFDQYADDGKFVTFTYGEDGAKRASRPHDVKNLVGKVGYTIH